MPEFELVSNYSPRGDQPQAIENLSNGIIGDFRHQTLLGVTGSGKTFTMANVIQNVQRPTLVIAHNKTLAAQLFSEFRDFFPDNAVEYFVSYYDYYQPEAYLPTTDTYIEKDSSINEEIDRLRLSATKSLMERRDVIVVSSVSCIYNLGSPKEWQEMSLFLKPGDEVDRSWIFGKLVDIQYERNDVEFTQGTFRARGDTVEIFPAQDNVAVRVEMFGDEIDRISYFEPLTGKVVREVEDDMQVVIYPAKHFVMPQSQIDRALVAIEEELKDTVSEFEKQGQLLEAQRIMQRTRFDIEMIEELGYCSGIENYSRHFDGRKPGEAPSSLLDFFPDDYLLIIDESHVTIPQIGGMHNGDRARKKSLIEYGFRLPSAFDNRPLNYREFEERINQAVYVSATPADYELGLSDQVVEQIIRPTGLVDPPVQVRPVANQIDDLMEEVRKISERGYRTLVTTLTKKMAEDLTDYLLEMGIRVRYMHSDIDTLERAEIVRELRKGTFDVLVGINLLREGLDIPEVALVAILDADKEGFLRSERSLIQTIGRASRNVDAYAIMYADRITGSMSRAMGEMERRRNLQLEFNRKHNITPTSIMKEIQREIVEAEEVSTPATGVDMGLSKMEANSMLIDMEAEMHEAARNLEFEEAARLRDAIREMRETYSL
ncbi:excinuclease ABC subunit UvrB [Methanohalophilus halophilus]|uniref:UvrABC system protein B n=1 Tax=Methanohalophilus halophilus TaxID=2177 RepID=A0A1L3Q041_9EURY|nr:excinuclease ABC subunit UvrB [Methanohalophilus halophilus]APH38240.1 excinuclease ABC subunit B [Methanohalophilus halophilus]RNI10893.1 excinuclease ABC subunit UvrB [Methanohalophilus halophilus]SDW00005.1 Excinuclease ABC subunit B [Methanohalophilus halophilus]